MTRLTHPSTNERKARSAAYQHRKLAERTEPHRAPLPKVSRFGFSPTTSTLTTTEVTLRRASNAKSSRPAPSMPRMPWEDTNA